MLVQSESIFLRERLQTIGNFDGVHLGHQQLLRSLSFCAKRMQIPAVVILFEPQPKEYFLPNEAPARLSSLREKLAIMKQYDIDYVYCLQFATELAAMEAKQFVHTYLIKELNIRYLLIGSDFKFGKGQEGDSSFLHQLGQKLSFEVGVQPDFYLDKEKVSSTKVRHALNHNQWALVKSYLGRNYSIIGRVIHGNKRGQQWGIPTANLSLNRLTLPLHGVFVVAVKVQGQKVFGVANVGCRLLLMELKIFSKFTCLILINQFMAH